MDTFPLLVSLDTRSTIDIDLPSCMSPSSDVFAVFLRTLRCDIRRHSVTVSCYAMPYHVMSWGLESIYCLSKRLQVFGLTSTHIVHTYILATNTYKYAVTGGGGGAAAAATVTIHSVWSTEVIFMHLCNTN